MQWNGRLYEVPGVVVDCFQQGRGAVQHAFLTHCHTDHLNGINTLPSSSTLYSSAQTFSLVSRLYPDLACRVETIEVGESRVLSLPLRDGRHQSFTVTAYDANHCPGTHISSFKIDVLTL